MSKTSRQGCTFVSSQWGGKKNKDKEVALIKRVKKYKLKYSQLYYI